MKVAITHDYLRDVRGGERTVEAMSGVWPEAPIYTAILNRERMKEQGWDLSGLNIKTSWMQKLE